MLVCVYWCGEVSSCPFPVYAIIGLIGNVRACVCGDTSTLPVQSNRLERDSIFKILPSLLLPNLDTTLGLIGNV